MSDIKEFQGKNLDEAIDSACKHFDLKRDKLEIEIVSGGSSGIFGLVGVKPAVVRAKPRGSFKSMVQETEEERKPAPRQERAERAEKPAPKQRESAQRETAPRETGREAASEAAQRESAPRGEFVAVPAGADEFDAPAAKEAQGDAPAAEGEGRSRRGERGRRGGRGRGRGEGRSEDRPQGDRPQGDRPQGERSQQSRGDRPQGERPDRSGERSDRGSQRRGERSRGGESQRRESTRRDQPQNGGFSEEEESGAPLGIGHLDQALLEQVTIEVTTKLLVPLTEDAKVTVTLQSDRVLVRIDDPENSGLLIGREGQTLASLQYLVNRLVSKRMDASVRVQIDTGDYRENQDEKLRQIARHLADKALASGRTQSTRPMSSYHRRVVHLTLQEDEQVFTRSKGEGSMKRVLIVPKQRDRDGELIEETVQDSQE